MRAVNVSDVMPAARYLSEAVMSRTDNGKQVLLLLSGGSCIDLAVAVAKMMAGHDLSSLTVSLTDERFGTPGHNDSNWQKLVLAGADFGQAAQAPVLTGTSLQTTVERYGAFLENALATSDYTIGLFGMGTNGHTAGLQPGSPALSSKALACAFEWTDFTRVTMTIPAIQKLDEAILYAVGQDKQPLLKKLLHSESPLDPIAQILKQVPELTIFNDLEGEAI
jgi:6-phosphogluconolactonase/glucosamine-6-phosphate isomerase/deaminase